jgi:hypothetical protein
MGVALAYELTTEIPDAGAREKVVALAKGSVSEIIKTDAGWTFYRAEETPQPADTSDTDRLSKIRSYIMDFAQGRVEDYFISEADSFIALSRTNGFDEAVAEKGFEKKHFGPVSLNYGSNQLLPPLDTSLIRELPAVASNENFWQTSFSTPLNTVSKSFVASDNVLVLYPLEQSDIDESTGDYIESAYPDYRFDPRLGQNVRSFFRFSSIMEQNIHLFFMSSDKLKDNFSNIYSRYLQPSFQ